MTNKVCMNLIFLLIFSFLLDISKKLKDAQILMFKVSVIYGTEWLHTTYTSGSQTYIVLSYGSGTYKVD